MVGSDTPEVDGMSVDSAQPERSLAPGNVHVWTFHLDPPAVSVDELAKLLSSDERARAQRFHFEQDRRRFCVARGSLRRVLASYTEIAPEQLVFEYSTHGKPYLSQSSDVRFNLSHSDNLALCAIARNQEIGVDIERVRNDVEIEQLAQRFFSSYEFRALSRVEREFRARAFFRIWTCKEAFVKAQGMGLSLPLDSFDVEVDLAKPAGLLAWRSNVDSQWALRGLEVPEGYAAALAIEGEIGELTMR